MKTSFNTPENTANKDTKILPIQAASFFVQLANVPTSHAENICLLIAAITVQGGGCYGK